MHISVSSEVLYFDTKLMSLGPEPHHAALMCDTEESVGERVEGNLLAYQKQISNKQN